MDRTALTDLLEAIKRGDTTVDQGVDKLVHLPFEDLGFARIDSHRSLRRGFPEVIFCKGKTPEQVAIIAERMVHRDSEVLATRATEEAYREVVKRIPSAQFFPQSGAITVQKPDRPAGKGHVAIVSAGTSDIPVAEEAAITARMLGAKVSELYDVGVAGLHRVLNSARELRDARVIVVAAGMEGALASVVSGLVAVPVVAVPTSIGYGASFNGLAALLGMLNSCSSGVVVVNIDNGFGAGYAAGLINRLALQPPDEV